MHIALGSDHAGYRVKEKIKTVLSQTGCSYEDFGTSSEDSVDYPDFAVKVAQAVSQKQCERGILICATGLGMCIAANKINNIRAVTCDNEFTAEMSRRHNDANILCLGARVVPEDKIESIIRIWLTTPFESGRHMRRLEKIKKLELPN